MEDGKDRIRAYGLCSGGLDSILAGLVLREQDIDVQWISFETPFFSAGKARKAARMTGIPLRVERITETYLKMLRNPNLGYGKHMNPCCDCHALMFNLAGRIMEAEGGHLLFSGEVLGQRPMSQVRNSLRYVEKHSGYRGYILRPLSAKKLDPTIPEERGWVDRERLLDFAGRGRKPQIALAEAFGITDYPAPAGGCLLTDKGYSKRLADLFEHMDDTPERDLELLKHGRHFRLDPSTKAVVGRNKSDNDRIEALYDPSTDILCSMMEIPGPRVLVPGIDSDGAAGMAARLCARYSRARDGAAVRVLVSRPGGRDEVSVPVAVDPNGVAAQF
ncbi:MAG: tRNA 4-thiouridine(8) synthase ThiI [Desulfatibacillaceae bacterium]